MAPVDVGTVLTAARGAPPVICALAAHAVHNWGWGHWTDAPFTPLPAATLADDRDEDEPQYSPADQELLLSGLASDDACVRELSVRLLSRHSGDRVAAALVTRLGSTDASLRAIAAVGLGFVTIRFERKDIGV
jgi:hypothetical protein